MDLKQSPDAPAVMNSKTRTPASPQKMNCLCQFIRVIILMVCVTGFIYQSVQFFMYFCSYPTVVSMELQSPDTFIAPAMTFCNVNRLVRSKFCALHPNDCEKPKDMKVFCEKLPHYCKRNISDFMIPQLQYYIQQNLVSPTEILALGHDVETFFSYSYTENDISGPYYFEVKETFEIFPCFTVNSRVDSSLEPRLKKFYLSDATPLGRFKLNVEEDEMFDPRAKPGALFAAHSPYVAVNPYFKGTLMKPGNTYKIHMRLEKEHLLHTPHPSDCLDYEMKWRRNNNTGPRSQKMCKERCSTLYDLACYGCNPGPSTYAKLENMCSGRFKKGCKENKKISAGNLQQCIAECKNECTKLKYRYTVEERSTVQEIYNVDGRDFIYVDIYVDDPEILTITHKPQFQNVEIFSYLGGFLGCWLGISFSSIANLIQKIYISIRTRNKSQTISTN